LKRLLFFFFCLIKNRNIIKILYQCGDEFSSFLDYFIENMADRNAQIRASLNAKLIESGEREQ
jgi:hypothetical protein